MILPEEVLISAWGHYIVKRILQCSSFSVLLNRKISVAVALSVLLSRTCVWLRISTNFTYKPETVPVTDSAGRPEKVNILSSLANIVSGLRSGGSYFSLLLLMPPCDPVPTASLERSIMEVLLISPFNWASVSVMSLYSVSYVSCFLCEFMHFLYN